jgi:hypothetical protein
MRCFNGRRGGIGDAPSVDVIIGGVDEGAFKGKDRVAGLVAGVLLACTPWRGTWPSPCLAGYGARCPFLAVRGA